MVLSTFAVDDFSESVKLANDSFSQVPSYIIEQRKNIVGLWVNEYDSKNRIEFKSNGTGVVRYASEPPENFNYQIVNTTPQCGYQLTQEQLKSSSFLQTYEPEDATTMECKEIKFLSQERLIYVPVGDNPGNRVIYIKSKIVLDKVKE
ncbi:MAG: hypothetical protein CUR34_14135 [Sediminibacterium sp.]|nr:MAG: hypothetical protein CUR34_14135 [Sediminibacterium sp.] [Sediminibacterium sp. FEMGT703S]